MTIIFTEITQTDLRSTSEDQESPSCAACAHSRDCGYLEHIRAMGVPFITVLFDCDKFQAINWDDGASLVNAATIMDIIQKRIDLFIQDTQTSPSMILLSRGYYDIMAEAAFGDCHDIQAMRIDEIEVIPTDEPDTVQVK